MSVMLKIDAADYAGATGTYAATGAVKVRVRVTNDEGGFDVWARTTSSGKWWAEWPAELSHDRVYAVRAELWDRKTHVEVEV